MTPPFLIINVKPGAPVPRAKETIQRLMRLLDPTKQVPTPQSELSPVQRPRLTLLKGGKEDPPGAA